MPETPGTSAVSLPVELLPGDVGRQPQAGRALCLSGGGYRAMLFHAGALWRLYEADYLRSLKRISSVSGGSITSAVLALKWGRLSFDPNKARSDFLVEVIEPIKRIAGMTLDVNAVVLGALLPGKISERVAAKYRKHLFGSATLQDLPDDPRFVFNATNVQSGALWRFMKPYMRDWRVGEVRNPRIQLGAVVAASSAFPPMLSPVLLRLSSGDFTPDSGDELQREPYTTHVVLTDAGVYDNLGLETAFKKFKTVLVSDAGGRLKPEEKPKNDWARHLYRVLNLIDNQVRSLRKRILIEALRQGVRDGAYWGIRTDIANYHLTDPLTCPHERTLRLAATPTRLKRLDPLTQERLINWGYAVTDAALRAHVDPSLAKGTFPYPASEV